ncbi:type I restriction enzyme HsdR N-terminal domain-containing protein [Micavibrio aeruginosavorus]|uniref:type I restriction enzyme HsdR N-terminal domain-containing protein n=1 Tax=Micavibrio aeruginosavorus TaxID=349221 RepID=UPI003F4AC674
MSVPAKAAERIKTSLKRFQPILQSAKARDVNESDTVTIITDMLEHIFGYDKYTEITSEYAIRGTFCDLALKIDGKLVMLMEVKAIGLDLKEQHLKQAINYAANEGIEWVSLTNGVEWRIYRVSFGKPINFELVESFNMLDLAVKDKSSIDVLSLLAKEGIVKSKLELHHSHKQILNRFTVGAIVMSETVVSAVRRELRRMSPEAKISEDEIKELLANEVIKREVIEGEKAQQAQKKVSKAEKKALRKAKDVSSNAVGAPAIVPAAAE